MVLSYVFTLYFQMEKKVLQCICVCQLIYNLLCCFLYVNHYNKTMKRKLIALSILFFLLGTAGSIYVFPIQEALFVTKTTVDTTFQEITKGL